VTQGRPAAARPDFDRLLERDSAHLIAGHGTLVRDGVREALARSCDEALGPAA
jgi:hypothetical protein